MILLIYIKGILMKLILKFYVIILSLSTSTFKFKVLIRNKSFTKIDG